MIQPKELSMSEPTVHPDDEPLEDFEPLPFEDGEENDTEEEA